MMKIGIVGGVGWQSTVEYYSEICRRSAPSTPEMSIESLDLNKAVAYLGAEGREKSWTQFDEYHRAALRRLEANGADFAIIASNTPHHRLSSIVQGIGIAVIDLFEAVARESARVGAKEVLVLGTALTMNSSRFREQFEKYEVEARGPHDETAREMTVELIADLQFGNAEGAAERVAKIVRLSGGTPIVCLACTELPLAFPELKNLAEFECEGIRYINTVAVHINAAMDLIQPLPRPS